MALSFKILVTGATGFIGNALTRSLVSRQEAVRVAVRKRNKQLDARVEQAVISNLSIDQDWTEALDGVEVIIHCAARVHVMNETARDPLSAYREVNVEGTKQLAQQAAKFGVKRFIFLSTIKVNGESTHHGSPFYSSSTPHPVDLYSISKWEAEQAIHKVCSNSAMDYSVVRPVLVYGPGVKANFAQLIKIARAGIPLPLHSARNKRSIVSLDNLVDLLAICASHPQAANQTFLVSDGKDLSTSELINEICLCLGKKPKLIPFPPTLLKFAAKMTGKRAMADRLLGSLQVDIEHTKKKLDWQPRFAIRDSLQKTVDSLERGEKRGQGTTQRHR